MAWKRCPRSVNSTTFTEPGGPMGDAMLKMVKIDVAALEEAYRS